VEIVGGIWVLLISIAAMRSRLIPVSVNDIDVVIGIFGVLAIVPSVRDFGVVLGLSQFLWFALVGIVMLLSTRS
jgi:hypothetical protein